MSEYITVATAEEDILKGELVEIDYEKGLVKRASVGESKIMRFKEAFPRLKNLESNPSALLFSERTGIQKLFNEVAIQYNCFDKQLVSDAVSPVKEFLRLGLLKDGVIRLTPDLTKQLYDKLSKLGLED